MQRQGCGSRKLRERIGMGGEGIGLLASMRGGAWPAVDGMRRVWTVRCLVLVMERVVDQEGNRVERE